MKFGFLRVMINSIFETMKLKRFRLRLSFVEIEILQPNPGRSHDRSETMNMYIFSVEIRIARLNSRSVYLHAFSRARLPHTKYSLLLQKRTLHGSDRFDFDRNFATDSFGPDGKGLQILQGLLGWAVPRILLTSHHGVARGVVPEVGEIRKGNHEVGNSCGRIPKSAL